jgi:hypothetical protein
VITDRYRRACLSGSHEIVKRPGDLHTFQGLPRRWVIERTLAWITRCRRTVRDYERLPGHHETIAYWAMTITMTRRLGRRPVAQLTAAYCPGSRPQYKIGSTK